MWKLPLFLNICFNFCSYFLSKWKQKRADPYHYTGKGNFDKISTGNLHVGGGGKFEFSRQTGATAVTASQERSSAGSMPH